MKALVTGATGFVGGHLIETLVRHGHEVTALVRSPERARGLAAQGVRLVEGDLAARAALATACAGQDVVFHVAGVVAARSDAEYLAANRDGTAALLEAATHAGSRRFVLVSSLAAAGPSQRGQPLQGHEPPAPVTAYGRSKLAAEDVVRAGPLPWTIVRPPMVYGPRDREVFKAFQLADRTGGLAPVFGDGSQELSAVFAPDLAEALLAAAEPDATVGGTYVACHPETFTVADFSGAVARSVGRTPRLLRIPPPVGRGLLSLIGAAAGLAGQATVLNADKANEFFAPAWTGDPAPLARDARWQATTAIATGLPATARWYRDAGWL